MSTDTPDRASPWLPLGDFDRRCVLALQRRAGDTAWVAPLAFVSRVGDGWLWYATIAALLWLGGPNGAGCARMMSAVGLVNLGLYLVLKHSVGRARPYIACADIRAGTPALDRYSFPSGHTLHAISFSILLIHAYPFLWVPLATLVVLVAASRVVLGLHYPSDVLAGAAIGALNATIAVLLTH